MSVPHIAHSKYLSTFSVYPNWWPHCRTAFDRHKSRRADSGRTGFHTKTPCRLCMMYRCVELIRNGRNKDNARTQPWRRYSHTRIDSENVHIDCASARFCDRLFVRGSTNNIYTAVCAQSGQYTNIRRIYIGRLISDKCFFFIYSWKPIVDVLKRHFRLYTIDILIHGSVIGIFDWIIYYSISQFISILHNIQMYILIQ